MMLGIAGYCGILVMVLCIAVIAGLLCWFLRSALRQKNQLGMMMGFGCVMVLAIQFLLSLMANIGVLKHMRKKKVETNRKRRREVDKD